MGFMNKLNNALDNHKSSRDEKSDVKQLTDSVDAEHKAMDEQLMAIGQFYWNLYANDPSFVPAEDIKGAFTDIETRVARVKDLEIQIAERKEAGEAERQKNNEETAAREEEMRLAKEEAARQKSEEREARKAAKELEKNQGNSE
jgi:hypothetical protein